MELVIEHPILGTIFGEKWEWCIPKELDFPSIGYAISGVIIAVDDDLDQPSSAQIQAIIDLMNLPESFRITLASAIEGIYTQEIRPVYLERINKYGDDVYTTIDKLPEIAEIDDVWGLISGLYSIWVNEDSSINVQYSVIYDDEHELNVQIDKGNVQRVWMA